MRIINRSPRDCDVSVLGGFSLQLRQGWVATANPTFYKSVYQYLDTEATAITSIYLVGIMEYHKYDMKHHQIN